MTHQALLRHNVQIMGNGPRTLVLAHGFGCDQSIWRHVVPALAAHHRVVLLDHVGHGESDPRAFDPVRHSTLEGYAQDIVQISEALDLHDAVLIGHSVSAMIGMLAIPSVPGRFSQLVMLSPSPCFLNYSADGYSGGFERQDLEDLLQLMDCNYAGWAAYLAPAVGGGAHQPEVSAEMQARFCALNPDVARTFARATFFTDLRAELPSFGTHTFIVQCAHDTLIPVSIGHYMQRMMPNAQLHTLLAHGHCAQLSHPEETVALIEAFITPLQAHHASLSPL